MVKIEMIRHEMTEILWQEKTQDFSMLFHHQVFHDARSTEYEKLL
jgi:hypothetical protein